MARLSARVRERSELSARDVASMVALFERYYDGGSPEGFERDLADKTHVIELRDNDELRGFSTLAVFGSEVGGLPIQAIFSGDTIVHHENWGEQALAHSFCRLAGEVKARAPDVALYWMLISMGHRTYRYLHAFAREYFPSYAAATPLAIAEMLDTLYRQRFGSHYDPTSGIIRLGTQSRSRLRAEWRDAREALMHLPHVAFFFERNPGHVLGDELACICRLEASNLRSIARRAFLEGTGP